MKTLTALNPLPPARRLAGFFPAAGFFLLAALLARATTVVPPDFAQLVNESDYIVRAVVKSVTSEWRQNGTQRSIFTKIQLEVREVITGTPPQPLVLEMLGGKVGQEEMAIAGAPKFAVGQEDILFVQGNGRNIYPLFAIMHGRYPILKDAAGQEYVARSNHLPLHDPAEVALPMAGGAAAKLQGQVAGTAAALTPAQFTQQIRAAVNPSYVRARQN